MAVVLVGGIRDLQHARPLSRVSGYSDFVYVHIFVKISSCVIEGELFEGFAPAAGPLGCSGARCLI